MQTSLGFNTAILYDIENLVQGYHKANMILDLSIDEIFNEIKQKNIGRVAIQRAYANWSDPRLNTLREKITKLGIEPIQIIGFGKGAQKNASDIHLAVDAVDIAFHRNDIEIFVVVSGDGGFSILAKKLHEYGRMVIGCAYEKAANSIFQAVCDDFIWIEKIPEKPSKSKSKINTPVKMNTPTKYKGGQKNIDPILFNYCNTYQSLSQVDTNEMITEAREVLNFLSQDPRASNVMRDTGLNISVFRQALDYRMNDFNCISLGFVKFVDFIRYVTYESPCKLVHKAPSEYRLILRESSIENYADVTYIEQQPNIHTLENYQLLLQREHPIFKLPNSRAIYRVVEELARHRTKYQNLKLETIIQVIENRYRLDPNDIKDIVLALVSCGCFDRIPENMKVAEQNLSLKFSDSEEILLILEERMHDKLLSLLKTVDEEIFSSIISLSTW